MKKIFSLVLAISGIATIILSAGVCVSARNMGEPCAPNFSRLSGGSDIIIPIYDGVNRDFIVVEDEDIIIDSN